MSVRFGDSVDEARYAAAGVDIDAGNRMVELIKPLVRRTARPGADAEIGGFGGLFDLKAAGFSDPLLVAATDGVGTKVKIAIETGRHDTIGIDLVAMSVNDLVVQGAEPLFFLDYFACGKLDPAVGGRGGRWHRGSMPRGPLRPDRWRNRGNAGTLSAGDYDLAGFAVGAVARNDLLPRADIAVGRRRDWARFVGRTFQWIFAGAPRRRCGRARVGCARALRTFAQLGRSAAHADAALCAVVPGRDPRRPERSRRLPISPAAASSKTSRACCRIGLPSRWILPVPVQPVFKWLASTGKISEHEMLRTFNCGIGMIAVLDAERGRCGERAFLRKRRNRRAARRSGRGEGRQRVGFRGHLDLSW